MTTADPIWTLTLLCLWCQLLHICQFHARTCHAIDYGYTALLDAYLLPSSAATQPDVIAFGASLVVLSRTPLLHPSFKLMGICAACAYFSHGCVLISLCTYSTHTLSVVVYEQNPPCVYNVRVQHTTVQWFCDYASCSVPIMVSLLTDSLKLSRCFYTDQNLTPSLDYRLFASLCCFLQSYCLRLAKLFSSSYSNLAVSLHCFLLAVCLAALLFF
eukprot:g50032.t1